MHCFIETNISSAFTIIIKIMIVKLFWMWLLRLFFFILLFPICWATVIKVAHNCVNLERTHNMRFIVLFYTILWIQFIIWCDDKMNWYRTPLCVCVCLWVFIYVARLNILNDTDIHISIAKMKFATHQYQQHHHQQQHHHREHHSQNIRLCWGLVSVLTMFQSNVNEPNYFYVCHFAGLNRLTHNRTYTHRYTARFCRYWTLALPAPLRIHANKIQQHEEKKHIERTLSQ